MCAWAAATPNLRKQSWARHLAQQWKQAAVEISSRRQSSAEKSAGEDSSASWRAGELTWENEIGEHHGGRRADRNLGSGRQNLHATKKRDQSPEAKTSRREPAADGELVRANQRRQDKSIRGICSAGNSRLWPAQADQLMAKSSARKIGGAKNDSWTRPTNTRRGKQIQRRELVLLFTHTERTSLGGNGTKSKTATKIPPAAQENHQLTPWNTKVESLQI
jgi:hypothetical protein